MKQLALLLLFAAGACGGSSAGSSGTPAKPARPALPDIPFEQMDHAQQHQFMEEVVMPTMMPIFQNHNPKDFAQFGCETCHGKEPDKAHFEMPNASLPKLNFKDMSKFKKEDLEWMGKEVEPQMAKLLKQPVYTEENPKGFGCLACHTQETP